MIDISFERHRDRSAYCIVFKDVLHKRPGTLVLRPGELYVFDPEHDTEILQRLMLVYTVLLCAFGCVLYIDSGSSVIMLFTSPLAPMEDRFLMAVYRGAFQAMSSLGLQVHAQQVDHAAAADSSSS